MTIVVILLLVIVNGLFAMAEMAVVSARKTRLQQWASQGHTGAAAALELSGAPDRFLSTIQIGITLISILAGAFGERGLVDPLASYIMRVSQLGDYSETVAFGLVIVVLTYVSLIFGELVPKRLALHSPEKIAALVAGPMRALSGLGGAAVRFLSGSTQLVLRVLGIRPSEESPITEEEIKVMLEKGTEAGVFEEAEHDIVKSTFKLADHSVGVVMKPRRDVVWLDIEASEGENRQKLASALFSRFPVGQGSLDNVIGVVHTKDLFVQCLAGRGLNIREALRPPLFVPEALPALRLLESFKKSRTHMAMVVDEYGGVEGLVTLNDVMEDLVGEVASADMPQERQIIQRPDGSWLIDGRVSIGDLKEELGVKQLPEDEGGGFQTLGGFVMHQIGRVPVSGDRFESSGFTFEVVDMDGKRVDKVLVTRQPENFDDRTDAENSQ